jgi:hypothetical protein
MAPSRKKRVGSEYKGKGNLQIHQFKNYMETTLLKA